MKGSMMFRAVIIAALFAVPAAAQEDPEQEWNSLPGDAAPPPPAPPPLSVPPGPLPSSEPLWEPGPTARASIPTVRSPRPVLEPNTISMFGARSLGVLQRGQMLFLGFPLIGIRLALG